ncbi:MAG: hypothetical protein LBS80_05650 [Tannerella sp.]|jgi:hypothetical protein|nr:hypothetical protein [Tannerella sp.]
MKRILCFILILGLCFHSICINPANPAKPKVTDGYPVANFALTVNASENGSLYGRILQNPGRLGEWLADRGSVAVLLEKNGERHDFSDFKQKLIRRSFPFVSSSYSDSPLVSSEIDLQTFCPLAINDINTSALPVVLLELTFENTATDEAFNIIIRPDSAFAKEMKSKELQNVSGVGNHRYQVSCNSATLWKEGELIVPVSLKAGERKTLHLLFAFYDDEWISANQFRNIDEISDYAHKMWSVLKEKTLAFGDAIPQTGDVELDKYLRWYMIPGISLTKCTKNNEIVTMGYRELNQRDSYWTSWLHLVLFKDAERRMIEESVACQQPSGKIPTTILPLIERNDDLDINAFFILRATRFFQYYNDRESLATWWPALTKAMDWLVSRDTGDGIPAQVSFWGDWKDVMGVENRKYSPFSGLIYLAALRQMMTLSAQAGAAETVRRYEQAYQKGYEFINKSTRDGGLWHGDYYCQLWKDGQVNDKLLQDQTIGILFDVVPPDRAVKIIASLNAKSLTPYGVAETFPYYPASFGYRPATYHNGAVWPWLSFMDCWARIHVGKTAEAIELVKRVAKADLVESGDWSPNEHINSLTGENLGFQLQGWNAGLFGLVYFGILHQGIIP